MRPSSRVLWSGALFVATALSQTPLIQNGDFEQPVIGPPFVSSIAVPGWTHGGNTGLGNLMHVGYSDQFGTAEFAGHGNQFLLLGAGLLVSGASQWSTDITGLTPGATYSLSFLMASQFPLVANTLTVSFMTGSSTSPQTFTLSATDFKYWATWEPKQMNFVATASTATLVFSIYAQFAELGIDYVNIAEGASPGPTPSISSIALPINIGNQFTPGGPMLISGTDLGNGPDDVAAISVNGEAAPLVSFLDTGDIIAQVPVDIPLGSASVAATRNSVTTSSIPINVTEFSPAIYYQNVSAFMDSGGNPIIPSHLAIPGTSVSCSAIGLGPTKPPMATGVKAAAKAPAVNPVQVMVGNQLVTPSYAGLLVGSVTDYQVTFEIPQGTPVGPQAVTISVGGLTSNAVTLLVGPSVPQINAIVNGASFKSGPASANSFVSLFGLSFGSGDTTSNIFPDLLFNQVSVLVNGAKVPLYTVSGTTGQINLVLPSNLPAFGNAVVEVTNAEGTSAEFPLPLAPDSVGLFRVRDPSDARRQNGSVLFANTAWNVMPVSMAAALGLPSCAKVKATTPCGQPAKAGDQIQIYLTGLGKATPNGDPDGAVLPTGSLTPADGSVLYKTVQIPSVKIGGIAADVSFSGIAPGSAGEYQINVAIPRGVQPGDSVPLTVTMPDGSTDTVTIAVES